MEHKHTNKLINEKSPYLLQHAHNPVDWFPWGDEAFKKAKAEEKPIFLSIGYSTCHWCHVMERESFEDEEVAALLNENYVSIKVDREERPDIDTIYMSVCQAMTGQGGWPLTVIMSPNRKPFFAGTYFPKHSRMGMPGLMDILREIKKLWDDNRSQLEKSGQEVARYLDEASFSHQKGELGSDVLDVAFDYYHRAFDPEFGGFGSAPKFPTPHNLMFLLRYWKMTGQQAALDMVEKTLQSMYQGGIYDHIGFGFARYSTDRRWLVPHFEKMLYDNALLAIAYLEAFQATGKTLYARAAREIFAYVERNMTSGEGGFFSAEDADSEGEEGRFYLWSPDEVAEVLGMKEGENFCRTFDITQKGNFEGKSIPNLIVTGPVEGLDQHRRALFEAREGRVHPFKDDKILTAWNGLMIAALAMGARYLQDEDYAESAEKAFDFIWQKLRRPDGRLLARYREGEASYLGYLDDYAFLVWGLIELYQATFKPVYLERAIELNKAMLKLFWDEKEGGLYLSGSDAEQLIARPKEIYDGALPSGNSVAALNMLRLSRLTGDVNLAEVAAEQLKAFGGSVSETPPGHAYFLMAVYFNLTPVKEITVVGDLTGNEAREMIQIAAAGFNPDLVMAVKPLGEAGRTLELLAPVLKDKKPLQDKTTAYVCRDYSCRPPVTEPAELEKMLSH